MRVFLTGATGFIGSAVAAKLLSAGHEVTGLARSDAAAARLEAAGVQPHRGDLDDRDSLRRGAGAADGVVHTAFIHDFSAIERSGEVDNLAIETMGAVLEGRPLVIASGTGSGLAEDAWPAESSSHRAPSELTIKALAERGVRATAVRLPVSVHGRGDHGFVARLIAIARERGVSGYIGDGGNRWPAVHRLDAARLFRMALESAPAGARLHAVGDPGIPVRDIAEVIGRHLALPVVSVDPGAAAEHFGWLARWLAMDLATSGPRTRALLGWEPEQPGLLADLEEGHYFSEPGAAVA